MTGKLPININHLLRQRTIEGERIECKAGWNPQSVLHTVCAFANDFHNLGGGYVVLGVKELELAEGRSTGVPKILRAIRQNGSPEPAFESDEDRTWFLVRLPAHERADLGPTGQVTDQDIDQVTPQVTQQVEQLVAVLAREMSRAEIQAALQLRHRNHFTTVYLKPALEAGLIEMTLPGSRPAGTSVIGEPQPAKPWLNKPWGRIRLHEYCSHRLQSLELLHHSAR